MPANWDERQREDFIQANKAYEPIFLADPRHPLYPLLKRSPLPLFSIHSKIPLESLNNPFFIEFGLQNREEKIQWLKEWDPKEKYPIFLEGSSLAGQFFLEHFPQVKGLHAGAFPTPQKKLEVFLRHREDQDFISALFKQLDLSIYFTQYLGIGFTFPRVVSMIINEAHLALDDKLASPKAIDTAMKFGVNYPLGPFEWKEKIGAKPIVELLDELHRSTGHLRYLASPSLRRESRYKGSN